MLDWFGGAWQAGPGQVLPHGFLSNAGSLHSIFSPLSANEFLLVPAPGCGWEGQVALWVEPISSFHGVPGWHPGTLKGNLKAPSVDHLLASHGVVTSSFLPLPGLHSHSMWGILYTSVRQNFSNIFSFDTGFPSFTNPRKPTFIRPFHSIPDCCVS